jgi:diguanylate cyclase (GGDEF)-like protein
MSNMIKIMIVSNDAEMIQSVRGAITGAGSAGAMRVRQDFVQRWQLVRAGSGAEQPRWSLSTARSVDAATDSLEAFVENAATMPTIVLVDSDIDRHDSLLLFLLTTQAVSEQVQLVLLSRNNGASLRSALEELGDGDRCAYLRKPVALDELARVLTYLAWRGVMTLNLRNAQERGFSGVGAADLASAMIMESEAEQKRMAVQDALTKLGNRRLFDASLTEITAKPAGARSQILMLIDLDRFKAVNDTLGHAAGDELLQQVADRLRELASANDVLFRLGGDEFALLRAEAQGAQEAAEAVIASLNRPFTVAGRAVRIGASIGWSPAPERPGEASEWTARADAALYAAKGAGRGVAIKYSEDQARARRQRVLLEDRVRSMIARGHAPLLYTVLADPRSGSAGGVEAVLDFDGDGRAESTLQKIDGLLTDPQLAIDLALWTARSACEQIARVNSIALHLPLTMRVLMSEDAIETLIKAARASSITPQRIVIEATASEVLAQLDAVAANVARLRGEGILLVLRSFGVGMFSLQGLQKLKPYGVKLAASLAKEAVSNGPEVDVVAGLVAIARGCGLKVLAAGADSDAEWNKLASMGCVRLQGRVVSTLMTIDSLRQRLSMSSASELAHRAAPAKATPPA